MSRWLAIFLPILIACSAFACNEYEKFGQLIYPCAQSLTTAPGDMNRNLATANDWSVVMNTDYATSELLAVVSVGLIIAWIGVLARLIYLRFFPRTVQVPDGRGFDVIT